MGNTSVIIISLIVVIGLFLLCRELLCWYWKINKGLENQQKIIELLQQIVNKASDKSFTLDKNNFTDYLDKHILITQKDGSQISGKSVQSDTPGEYLALFTDGSVKKIKLEAIKNIELV